MSAHGGPTFWAGHSGSFDTGSVNADIFNMVNPNTPCTLVRTLIWVTYSKWIPYETGDSGVLFTPVGFALGDNNSADNPWGDATNDPANDGIELVATDSTMMSATGLGWPPTSTATLTGSINEISSSGELDTAYNINAFMYAWGTSYVDSKAQRKFNETPQFTLAYLDFSFSSIDVQPGPHVNYNVRMLFHQAA